MGEKREWSPLGMENESRGSLYDGIPSFMRNSVAHWSVDAEQILCCQYPNVHFLDVNLRKELIEEFERKSRVASILIFTSTDDAFSNIEWVDSFGLKYVDYLVHKLDEYRTGWEAGYPEPELIDQYILDLDDILEESGSRWKIGWREGYAGLEERVEPAMQDMADDAMDDSNETSSRLLSKAWHALFGQNPNYSLAYSTAIKAVEAVAIPMVSPRDLDCTLSKAAQVMRDQGWGFELEPNPAGKVDGGIVQVIMNAMVNSQPDRHGGAASAEDAEVSKERAEAAVYSAVYLIQCFKSGLVLPPKKRIDEV